MWFIEMLVSIKEDDLRQYKIISILFSIMAVSPLYSQTDSTDCVFRVHTLTGKKVYSIVDKMPEPVGGQKVLLKKLGQEVKLGQISEEKLTGEMTVVSFVVGVKGEIFDKKVEREDFRNKDIPEQMFAVIESLTWIPGSCNGYIVPVKYVLPLRICLK